MYYTCIGFYFTHFSVTNFKNVEKVNQKHYVSMSGCVHVHKESHRTVSRSHFLLATGTHVQEPKGECQSSKTTRRKQVYILPQKEKTNMELLDSW